MHAMYQSYLLIAVELNNAISNLTESAVNDDIEHSCFVNALGAKYYRDC